jgi:transcriptional regulator with XRE-family HTH domain
MAKAKELGRRIRTIRHTSTQAEFASILGVTQSMVSAWESGREAPSTANWVKIADLTGSADADWCWEQSGLDYRALAAQAIERIKKESKEGTVELSRGTVIPIPRFHLTEQGRKEAGRPLPLPVECIPRPLATICISVDQSSNVIEDAPRGIVILDTSYEGVEDLTPLWGRVVMLHYAPDDPLSISPERKGIYMGRLEADFHKPYESEAVRLHGTLVRLVSTVHPFIHLGVYAETKEKLEIALKKRGAEQKLSADFIGERALEEFRLLKGIRILGKVIGRLTGHLEMEQAKDAE